MWAHMAKTGLFSAEFIVRRCSFIGRASPVKSQPIERLYFTSALNGEKDVINEGNFRKPFFSYILQHFDLMCRGPLACFFQFRIKFIGRT